MVAAVRSRESLDAGLAVVVVPGVLSRRPSTVSASGTGTPNMTLCTALCSVRTSGIQLSCRRGDGVNPGWPMSQCSACSMSPCREAEPYSSTTSMETVIRREVRCPAAQRSEVGNDADFAIPGARGPGARSAGSNGSLSQGRSRRPVERRGGREAKRWCARGRGSMLYAAGWSPAWTMDV